MKKYMEYHDEKSNKFWEITLNGASFTVRFGKTGTAGQVQTKEFGAADEAKLEAEKLLKEKLKKGYCEKAAHSECSEDGFAKKQETPFAVLPPQDSVSMNTSLVKKFRRIGLGHPTGGGFIDNEVIIFSTRAALWRWKIGGKPEEIISLSCERLALNRTRNLAAVITEFPLREVVILSLSDGSIIKRMEGHGKEIIREVAFSLDGKFIATGATDHKLLVRETETGTTIFQTELEKGFTSMDGNPDLIQFSPDGSEIIASDNKGNIWIWNLESGQLRCNWTVPEKVNCAVFSPDGEYVALATDFSQKDRFLRLHRRSDGELEKYLPVPPRCGWDGGDLFSASWSEDGQRIATAGQGKIIQIFNGSFEQEHTFQVEFDERKDSLNERKLYISTLSFSPDSQKLMILGSGKYTGSPEIDYCLEVRDLTNNQIIGRLDDFNDQVRSFAMLPGGRILSATEEGLYLYDGEDSDRSLIFSESVTTVDVFGDGKTAVLGVESFDGDARFFDLESRNASDSMKLTRGRVDVVTVQSGGKLLAMANGSAWLSKHGQKNPRKVKSTDDTFQGFRCAALSVTGEAAFGSWDGFVLIPADKDNQELELVPEGPRHRITALAFSPDGNHLAALGGFTVGAGKDPHGRITVWSKPWGEKVRQIVTEDVAFSAAAWSPDGRFLAGGTRGGVIYLFDMVAWKQVTEYKFHGGEITKLNFSPDGSYLIASSLDGTLSRILYMLQ